MSQVTKSNVVQTSDGMPLAELTYQEDAKMEGPVCVSVCAH